MKEYVAAVYNSIIEGGKDETLANVQQALAAGLAPGKLLNEGMILAMKEVGRLFEEGEYFVPEMLIAARAMQAGLVLLKPHLKESGVKPLGTVVIGTVRGDLHDIGKNLVAMMIEGAGFEVIDLGTNVAPDTFVKAVQEHQPEIVGMSALLTTTMSAMEVTIRALEDAGARESVNVMIGGAPITEDFADNIGADGFSPDASSAARMAKSFIK